MDKVDPVELLRRQYFQLIEPEQLMFPSAELLKSPHTQAQIFNCMFGETGLKFMPPERYRFRVLKRLMDALERAIEDPDEDEISDDISTYFAKYLSQGLPSPSTTAQQKSYVTYTVPTTNLIPSHFTLLEAPSLLASSGTTGFRTWEAALSLGTYLAADDKQLFVNDSSVLELGAGTGFLSILCAKYLNVKRVLATDGSQDVIADLKANLHMNQLDNNRLIQTAVLKWGHTLIDSIADMRKSNLFYDLVIGADVTYDQKSLPALVATIRELFELYPETRVLVSATVRNENTLSSFLKACGNNGFSVKSLDRPPINAEDQIGFFHPTSTLISIFLITNPGAKQDPFAS